MWRALFSIASGTKYSHVIISEVLRAELWQFIQALRMKSGDQSGLFQWEPHQPPGQTVSPLPDPFRLWLNCSLSLGVLPHKPGKCPNVQNVQICLWGKKTLANTLLTTDNMLVTVAPR